MPARRHPHVRLLRRIAVAIAAATASLLGAVSALGAADTHAYPRTYQVYSGWTDPNVLGRYDMAVGFANWDLAKLRAVNPDGVFLLQPGLNPSSGSDYRSVHITSGAVSTWQGATDTLAGGVSLGWIRPFDPYWDFLRNANGSKAGDYPTWNFADPRSKGTAELVAKVHAYAAKLSGVYAKGWDGIHTDEWIWTFVGKYGQALDADRDGAVDDQVAHYAAWQDGMARASRLIGEYLPGKTVGGNGAWWRVPEKWTGSDRDAWRSSINYTLIEHWDKHFYDSPQEAIDTARRWLDFPDTAGRPRYIATMQRALNCDGTVFQLPTGAGPNQAQYMLDPCVMKSMRWGLTLALMADVYYEIYAWPNHGTRWWYDEYDGGAGIRKRGYLGKPLGAPVRLAGGVYRRDFEHGVVLNNSTASTQAVQLGATFKKLQGTQNPSLNDGSLVTAVTLPAKDGIVLLRTSQAPAPQPEPAPQPDPEPQPVPEPQPEPEPAPQPGPATPVTKTFAPAADAFVKEAAPTSNFAAYDLWVDGGTNKDVETFLRFDLAGLSGTVTKATLRLFAYGSVPDGPAVAPAGTSWTERGVTWNNRPTRTGPAVADRGAVTKWTWVEYDVTPLVTGNGSVNLTLYTGAAGGLGFHSREDPKAPQLVVTTSG